MLEIRYAACPCGSLTSLLNNETLFLTMVTGAPVAQWINLWPTDLTDRV